MPFVQNDPHVESMWQECLRREIYPQISYADQRRQAHYLRCLLNGCSFELARMLAEKRFPGIKTGAALMKGVAVDDGLGEGAVADRLRAMADRAGVDRSGKRWVGGLAAYPGDPRAWVSDEHDVRVLARERGYAVDGAIHVDGPPPDQGPPPPPVPVAPDIVAEEIMHRAAEDPDLVRRDPREVYEQVESELTVPMGSNEPVVPGFAAELIEGQGRNLVGEE
jgi:hypothetical protein